MENSTGWVSFSRKNVLVTEKQHSTFKSNQNLLKLKKYESHRHYLPFYLKKSRLASTTTSILVRKQRQAFATVSVSK